MNITRFLSVLALLVYLLLITILCGRKNVFTQFTWQKFGDSRLITGSCPLNSKHRLNISRASNSLGKSALMKPNFTRFQRTMATGLMCEPRVSIRGVAPIMVRRNFPTKLRVATLIRSSLKKFSDFVCYSFIMTLNSYVYILNINNFIQYTEKKIERDAERPIYGIKTGGRAPGSAVPFNTRRCT